MFSTTVPIVKMPWSTQGPRHSLVISAPDEAPSSENLSGLPDELMRPDGVSKLEVTVRKALEEMFRTWTNLFHELFAGSGKGLQIEAEFLQTWFLFLIFQHFSSVLPIYIYIYIPKTPPYGFRNSMREASNNAVATSSFPIHLVISLLLHTNCTLMYWLHDFTTITSLTTIPVTPIQHFSHLFVDLNGNSDNGHVSFDTFHSFHLPPPSLPNQALKPHLSNIVLVELLQFLMMVVVTMTMMMMMMMMMMSLSYLFLLPLISSLSRDFEIFNLQGSETNIPTSS